MSGFRLFAEAEALDDRLNEDGDGGFAREPATHETAVDEDPAERRIKSGLRRGRIGPEAVEVPLVSQPRHVVDGFADSAHGRSLGERESGRGAVDAHQSASVFHHFFEIAAIDEVKPLLKAEPNGVAPDEPRPAVEAAVQRMRLQQQVAIGRSMGREAVDHITCGALHVRKRRVGPDLEVAGQLQRQQEQRLPVDAPKHHLRGPGSARVASEFPQPTEALHQYRSRPVRSVVRVAEPAIEDMMVVPVGVPGAPPEARRDRRELRGGRQPHRLLAEPGFVAAEGGAGVHALELERHPVRAEIALLEDVAADSAALGHSVCRDVVRPAVAE